ncbi:hypothetical protein B0T10DRAFT_286303 [Thelonectria olida]|uniref:Protection of telomeres protein 1 n=1 Tax=Thelonectria olida TaxID=1576542 RepID=A0A9P8W9Q4_9HYPO|nr:hypothetical protein B0T10DRAFT_286303 [Thelonectria olida]
MSPSQQPPSTFSLPPGYVSIRDVFDGKVREKSKVSMVGIVTDIRPPVPTRREDWKCQIRFFDSSVEDDEDASLEINIFRPKDELPDARCGDVVLVHNAKLQKYHMQDHSLLTAWDTKIYIYRAADIPKPPGNASSAMRPAVNPKGGAPTPKDHELISRMFHAVSKDRVPDPVEFETMKVQAANVKNKFRLLKDVVDGQFCDIVALVVRAPYDVGDKITLWVSDLTENPAFFHYAFGGASLAEGRDGDPHGYTSGFSKPISNSDWTGPFGKKSMQITCYEPHATAIRETQISAGSWVTVRNLQIKFGHNAANLEGYLREDRGASGIKIGIWSLEPGDDPKTIDPNLKEALRRKRDYERAKKEQLKEIAGAAKAGQRRKAEMPTEQETKKRKTRNRKKRQRSDIEPEEEIERGEMAPDKMEPEPIPLPDLTVQVKCEHQDKPTSRIADMLEPVLHPTTIDGKPVKLQLPFVNNNYRANVRVVDFLPSKLEAFAFPKKPSQYDVLSDNDDSDSGSDSELDMMTDFTTVRNWEWRFYLQLEDAVVPPNQQKNRVWVAVDNQAAQYLLNLDASDLRRDKDSLNTLRQTLFLLWGELEENNLHEQANKAKSIKAAKGDKPPPDSDDDEAPAPKTNGQTQVANRPFACCIRQYGVKVRETDETKADAGQGRRWQKMFGLFGTKIISK